MKKFRFIARDKNGQKVKGVVEAVNVKSAYGMLKSRNLVVIKLEDVGFSFLNDIFDRVFNRITLKEMATFTRQLSTMTTSGLQLTQALNILQGQASPQMSSVLAGVLAEVQGGASLSAAMSAYPSVFSKVYLALIRSGEAAGVLDKVLNRMAENLEKQHEFNTKVKSALIYPVIVVVGMIGVTFLMLVYVLPKLTVIYQDFETELPWPTKVLIGLSDFSTRYWWFMLVAGIAAVYLVRLAGKTDAGKMKIDEVKLKIPVYGTLLKTIILNEFSRTMSLMVSTGISIIEAINIVSESTGNLLYERSLKNLAKQVEKGFPMAFSLTGDPLYPQIVSEMVAVGEETGKVDDIFEKLAQYFETEAEAMVKGLTSTIEPIMLVILGLGVAFLAIAIILPIYNLTTTL